MSHREVRSGAIIGLGKMGAGMAQRHGFEVSGHHDRTRGQGMQLATLKVRAPEMLAGEFALENATRVFVKDLGAVRDAADDVGLDLPVGRAAHASFRKAAGLQP